MGRAQSKLSLELCGASVLNRTLESILSSTEIVRVVVPCPAKNLEQFRLDTKALVGHDRLDFIAGGESRQESVWHALEFLKQTGASATDKVIIHDGARCLITPALLSNFVKELHASSAATLGIPVYDTLKSVRQGIVVETVARDSLWAMQTPQGFDFGLLYSAHERAAKAGNFAASDDVGLLEGTLPVKVVMGDVENIKITCAQDLQLAAGILAGRV